MRTDQIIHGPCCRDLLFSLFRKETDNLTVWFTLPDPSTEVGPDPTISVFIDALSRGNEKGDEWSFAGHTTEGALVTGTYNSRTRRGNIEYP